MPAGKNFLTAGFAQLAGTFRELRRLPHTLRFLIAYLLYNDGIQTVIGSAAVFIAAELFEGGLDHPERRPSSSASSSSCSSWHRRALLFERIARLLGTKRAIIVSLAVGWG